MNVEAVTREVNLARQYLSARTTEAKEFFEQSRSKLDNPLSVDEELTYQREIFSKLKFQYLEQETRDKFLREISESKVRDITHGDVEEAGLESIEKKEHLKTLKSQLYDKIEQLKKTTDGHLALQKELEDDCNTTNSLLDETSHMQEEIDRLVNSHSGAAQELISSIDLGQESDIKRVVSRAQKQLNDEETALSNIKGDIKAKERSIGTERRDIVDLEQELQKLTSALNNLNPLDKPSKSQLFAKWCKELNDILLKFSPASNLELYKTKTNNYFTLSLTLHDNTFELIFDKNFTLKSVKDTTGNIFFPTKESTTDKATLEAPVYEELKSVIESFQNIDLRTTRVAL